MASPTRSWHETPSQREMELAVEQSIERLWSWMVVLVTSQLGPSVSPHDFRERMARGLLSDWQGPLETNRVDEAVRKTLQQLVHDDCRQKFRRTRNQSFLEIDTIPDPSSLHFATRLERDSQMAVVWDYIQNKRPDYQPLVERLFGFHEEEIKVNKLAQQLGIRPDTLRHRLYRLYAELRTQLSRLPHQS